MKILVIGAAGMIGRKLVERLAADGAIGGAPITRRRSGGYRRASRRRQGAVLGRARRRSTSPPPMSRPSWSQASPTRSFCSPRSSPARPRTISTRATRSISTARGGFSRRSASGICGPTARYRPRVAVHLLDRGVRRAVPRDDRRRIFHDPADQLRNAEGDLRTAARRFFAAADSSTASASACRPSAFGRAAQSGGLRLFLQYHSRAARRPGGGAAGLRKCAALARLAALGGRFSPARRQPRSRHGSARAAT